MWKTTKQVFPRVVSVFITFVLACQMILSNGVTLALAEEAQQSQSSYSTTLLSNGNGSPATTEEGEQLSDGTQGDSGKKEDGSTSDDAGEQPGGGSTDDATENAGSSSTSDKPEPDKTDEKDDAALSGQDGKEDATASDKGDGAADKGEESDEKDEGSDKEDESDKDKDAKQERTDPRAWNGDTDALKLASDGVSFEPATTLAEDADQAATEADPESDGTLSAALDGDEAPALPDAIPAELDLSLELDPTESDAAKDDVRSAVVAGDTLKVALPDGFSAANEGEEFDVYQYDADGNRTGIRIARAVVADDTLKLTFKTPENIDTGESYTVGEKPEEPAEGTSNLYTLRSDLTLEVEMDSDMVSDEEAQVEWLLQEGADGTRQTALLGIPSLESFLALLGLDEAPAADEEEQPAASAQDAANVLLDSSNGVVTESETTYVLGAFNEQISSTITWCDNNSGSRPSTSSLEAGFGVQYSVDGGVTYRDLLDANGSVTAQAKADLHMTDADAARFSIPLVDISQTAVGEYQVLSHALPESYKATTKAPAVNDDGTYVFDEHGEQVFYTDVKTTYIQWRFVDNNKYPGYVDGENSTIEHQYKMLTGEVEFNVVGKVGGQKLSDVFGAAEAGNFRFSASIDNKPVEKDISVAEAIEQGLLKIEDGPDGTTCVVSGTLPVYDEHGYPIVYYIQYTGEQNTDDYYQPTYDNSASASHGSAVDAVYDHGTMTLRHAGTTEYHGTKQWLDGGSSERPAVTFTLWRYSMNGGTAATASQVTLTQDAAVSGGTSSNSAASYVQVTLPAGSDDTVDLHKLLHDTYGDTIDQLPKYDPDGYPYVYALREEAIPGYEQVFGSVAEDGTVNDTPPTYQLPDGSWTSLDSDERPSNDRFIYNAGDNPNEGVVSNRLTGTTTVEMTKTWEIAAFQDDLKDVVCEFTAQSRPAGSDDEADWENVDHADAVQTLTGWNAETLTKTVTESFPKYDAHGNLLEYRWVETNVTLGDQKTSFTQNEDGAASFKIQVKDADGIDETLEFTSTPVTETADDGTVTTTITNTFENITEQHVDKYWEQPDGSMAQVAPDPAYSDGNAVIELYQDGVLVDTYTMDGKSDAAATPITKLGDATWQETSSYHIDFENLPKYSPEGRRYNYLVLETHKENWHTERTYDPDTLTTSIYNYFPEGEGSDIRVTKYWLDGDDAGHRLKVRAQLVALKHMESKAEDENGDPLYSYEEGDVVEWIDDDGEVQTTFDLTAAELWYAEIDVPIGGLNYKDFEVQEVALVDDRGTATTDDDVVYPVLTRDDAQASDEYKDESWVSASWVNPENRRVATEQHVYEVKSRYNDSMKSCEVTNRRLGLLDLTITKDWKDGLGDDPEDNTRPAAQLTLSCLEYGSAFTVNDNGELQVSVSGNILTVTDADGNPVKATIVDADGNPADAGNAVVEIDTSKASSTYEFFGLPKYDGDGMNVHYDVTEAYTGDTGDYTTSRNVGDYIVEEGMRHFHDTQDYTFTNGRSGTRDVTFYKSWHDTYVNDELNQRPDIYLTVYQVVDGGAPQLVNRYLHLTWGPAVETGEGAGDAAYEQKVVISDLPKYDSEGREITYYAVEGMDADGASLGYGDVTFEYDHIQDADEAECSVVIDKDAVESDDPSQNATGYAVREDGTFVNRLDSTLIAKGTKLWENIPGNAEQEDLPEVGIYLQQRVAGGEWSDMYVDVETKEVSGTVASTFELERTENNQYTYTIDKDYEGNPLPRYDENGNLYEYRAVEIVWGLLDQPGGFTADDLEGVNIKDLREGTADNTLTGSVYVIQHGETGSFLPRNIYQGDTGKLTVKKIFSGRDANDMYPDVTFEVYRYYVDAEGNPSDPARVASTTVPGATFKSNATVNEDGTSSYSHTFTDLDVYAPDGSRWVYFAVERDIDGYGTVVGTGDLELGDSGLIEGARVDATGATVDEGDGTGMRSEDLGTIEDGVCTVSVIADDETPDATFANDYDPEQTNLKGQKKWIDYNDAFTVRPDKLDVTFKRTAGSMTENVEVQTTDPAAPNYLAWDKDAASDTWTFELNNVEKWAPNGTAWTYTVTEDLTTTGADEYYSVVAGSSSVSANSTAQFRLENALRGQASVSKEWVDGGDPYGLRPENVTVELQARTKLADGTGDYSEWDDAYTVWKQFTTDEQLDASGLTQDTITRELSPDNGWKGSWRRLPVIARYGADSPLYNIEYRVVEVKIGDRDISGSVSTAVNPQDGKVYGEVHPYQPEQTGWGGDAQSGWATSISNTLETTKVTASKSWAGDDLNGTDDAWGTRPADGNSWTVTYFLQRRLQDGDWQWVVEAGSDADPAGSASQDGVVRLTISNGLASDGNHEVVVNDDGSVTVTWKNLPECDENGTPYEYRVVEQVPGSYDVTGATEVEDTDADHRYYVVAAAGDGSYAYENELRTVDLTGTKAWVSDYAQVDFDEGKAPKMTLWRQVGDDASTAEQVKMKDGSAAPQPAWNDDDGDGVWTFVYENLPAADENDEDYVYWAEEQVGSVDGWYPTYGTADAAGTEVDGDQQTGTQITNHPTLLNLAKVSDFAGDKVTLRNIELSVLSTDGKTTYAVWTNGADGKTVSAKVWAGGTTDPATDSNYVETDGSIEGLKAGKYIVRETGKVPEGYAQAKDVAFELKTDGTAVKADGVDFDTTDGVSTVEVTATDPVLRGHLELTKLVSDNGNVDDGDAAGLKGATFDLYRVDCDNDGKDELIAKGLTSADGGKVTTVGNGTAIEKTASGGTFDLTYDGKYTKLSDGLPEGEYYFLETNATPGAVMPEGEAAKSEVLEITQSDHYATTNAPVRQSMGNVEFNANISLIKRDADSGTDPLAGISGATFKLEYKAEGSTGGYVNLGSYSTDKNGLLSISDLEKGDYRLTETSNKGYVVTDDNRFVATFTLEDDDDDRVFDVNGKGAWDAIDFKVEQGELLDGSGVLNHRQTGQVALNKRGSNTAIDATFELQMKVGDEWKTVATGLETGNSYELAFNDDGVTATATDTGDLSTGQLKVTGLTWNTYRFQETETAPGYLPENGNGPVTSSEFTINRDNAASANVGVTVPNAQTDLRINKQGPTGEALNGAKFTVTPVDGSKFADNTTAAKTLITEKSGYATLKGLLVVGGTYEIYEVAGPSGYDPVDATFRVHVENDGYLTVVDGQGQETELPDGYARTDVDGQGTEAFSFLATNQPMAIKLTKVSSADGDLLLEGATFRLTGQVMFDNDTTHTYTTDENGNIDITEGLLGGVRYTLIEDQAPAGYITEAAEPITFYMDDRGEIDVDGEVPEGWTVNGDKISFTAENEPVELQITKRAPDNEDGTEGKLLDGATFTVTPVGDTTFADGSTDPVEMVTDDGTARITAQLVVGGTYDITETKAPDGFELVEGIMRVEVDEHGNINPIGSVDDSGAVVGQLPPAGYSRVDSDGDGTPDNAFEVKVVNQPIEISLVKVDRGDTMSQLPGATFEIAPQDGSKFADGTTAAKQFTTGDEGTLEVSEELAYGNTYTIREVEAPDGFELIEGELTFSVAENGEIAAVGDVPEGYGIEPDGVTVSASDEPIEVGFDKKGLDSDESLTGAEFTLSGTFVDDETHELSEQEIKFTTEGRVVSFAGIEHDGANYSLVAGETYTLTETKAPGGYELLDPFTFTVDEQGGISAADGSQTAAEGEEGYTISEQDGTVTLAAYDTPIEVTLAPASDGTPLAGATFELYQGESVDDGALYDTVTTEENGTVELTGLIGGTTYTLRETQAPAGYELLPDVTFTVDENGAVSFAGDHEGYAVTGQDGVATIAAEDEPIEAAIMKVDGDGNPLAGAVFTVTGKFADTASDKEERTLEASGADGTATIPSATLVAGETYTVTEVTAPDGFELAGGATFMVDERGNIAVAGTEEGTPAAGENGSGSYIASADGATAVIEATDAPVTLTVIKNDGGEKLLPGAEFTATEVGGDHTVTAVTGEDGTAVLEGLVAGKTYELAETKAPAGYERTADTLRFKVEQDGTVTVEGFAPAAFAVGESRDEVTVADVLIEARLAKLSTTGEALSGAVFEVEGTFAEGEGTREVAVADDGTAALEGLVAGETYTLTETKAPEGYNAIEGEWSFSVADDGTLSGEATTDGKTAGYAVAGDSVTVNAVDEPVEVPVTGGMPETGDWTSLLAYGMAASGLLFVGGGARHLRRRLNEIAGDDTTGDGSDGGPDNE